MRVVLITGDQLRHRWVASELAKTGWALSVYQDPARKNTVQQQVIEATLLEPPYYTPPLPHAWPGQPDLVLFYGCKLIDVTQFRCPVINLHLGLSPYYRGSGTNFWALHDGKPELVGATIHLATNEVDAGPILAQVRPRDLSPEDDIHTVGIKALKAGVKKLPSVVMSRVQTGWCPPETLWMHKQPGRLCKRKDYTPEAQAHCEQQLADGLLATYLNHKADRDALYPIVEG